MLNAWVSKSFSTFISSSQSIHVSHSVFTNFLQTVAKLEQVTYTTTQSVGATSTFSDSVFQNINGDLGGAIYFYGSALTVTNCQFTNCQSRVGAVYLGVVQPTDSIKQSSARFTNCQFSGNVGNEESSSIYSSGLTNLEFDTCTFAEGTNAKYYIAIYNTQITKLNKCKFNSNNVTMTYPYIYSMVQSNDGYLAIQQYSVNIQNCCFSSPTIISITTENVQYPNSATFLNCSCYSAKTSNSLVATNYGSVTATDDRLIFGADFCYYENPPTPNPGTPDVNPSITDGSSNTPNTGNTGNTGNTPNTGNTGNTGNTPNTGNTGNTGNTPSTENTGNTPNTGSTNPSGDNSNGNDPTQPEKSKTGMIVGIVIACVVVVAVVIGVLIYFLTRDTRVAFNPGEVEEQNEYGFNMEEPRV